MIHVNAGNSFDNWRATARGLLARRSPPADVVWGGETQAFLFQSDRCDGDAAATLRIPKAFRSLAEAVACLEHPDKWPLLYRVLFRLVFENRDLLNIESDADVRRLRVMEKAVDRDVHKFHAFVRFRRIECGGEEFYAAWHEPQHWTVERATPFFQRRFGSMKWSIFTPKGCAHWDLKDLTFSPPADRSMAPTADDVEDLWLLYYRSIFNPFRLNVRTMKRELPVRHWPTLPEASLIQELVRDAAK